MNSLEIVLEWLLSATLRASALAVIILICQQLMRRQLSAQWRYALWLPMLLVLVLPSLPAASFGLFPLKLTGTVAMDMPVIKAGDVASVEKSAAVSEVGTQAAATVNPFALAWLVGAGGVFAVGWIGYRRSMRRIVKNLVKPRKSLVCLIKIASLEAGVARMPRVLVSTGVDSPAVTGIFRPTLLLPAHFPDGFSEEEAHLILLHELTHLKRQDLAVNGLSCILQALHWFNPILWFAFARMRADREAACDASVLSIGTVDRRAIYGGALLKLQGGLCSRGLRLGFVGIFERSADMKSRIREISSHSPGRRSGWAIGMGMIALLVTFGATKAEEPAPQAAVEKAAEPMPDGYASITKKLTTIVIPQVDAEDMSLEEMVDFLTLRVKQLDTAEKDPAKKGINFVIRKNKGEDVVHAGHINMKKKNVLLVDVLKEMSEQSGMLFSWGDSGVTFFKRGQEMADFVISKPEPPPLPEGKAADFAMKLIIPRVDFEETTLRDAVDFLNKKAREITKEGPFYPIVLDPSVDPNAKIKELRIRNAPLTITLKYCMEQLKCTMTADDKEIRISLP